MQIGRILDYWSDLGFKVRLDRNGQIYRASPNSNIWHEIKYTPE